MGHLAIGIDNPMPPLVGFAPLSGVMVNTVIPFVTFFEKPATDGHHVNAALEVVCLRFRPVAVFSSATFIGLLPIVFKTLPSRVTYVPVFVSVAFGGLAAPVLVVLASPAVLAICFHVASRKSWLGTQEPDGTANAVRHWPTQGAAVPWSPRVIWCMLGDMNRIDYVYSAHSAYAYLGSKELSRICAKHDVTLVHKPILLTPVVEAQGSQPFHARTQAHVDYFFGREIERWAEFRGVPVIRFRPTHHDADYALASGMILALGDTGAQTDALAHAVLEAHWRDDADLSDPEALAGLAHDLGHDPEPLLEKAASDAVQSILQANSDWARAQMVFGSPTYIVNGDPFYGQDHLTLVERAVVKPFAEPGWTNPPVATGGH